MAIFPAHVRIEDINAQSLPPLEESLGFQFVAVGDEGLVGEFTVDARHLQPHGILHGGISCALGESMGSIAGNFLIDQASKMAVGQSLNAMHLRPALPGTLVRGVAKPLHVGGRSQIWEIMFSDKKSGKAICKVSLTLAVIDRLARPS